MRECIGAATSSRQSNGNQGRHPHHLSSFTGKRAAFRLLLMGVSLVALSALVPRSAAAQTWTGATSNDWTVGSNWSGGTAPAGGAVTISSGPEPVLGVNGPATATTGSFAIGSTGTNTLTIQNGSTLTSTGTANIGTTTGTATVTVTGIGSQWIVPAVLNVASNTSVGILNINNGASVTASTLRVSPTSGRGTVNINNGTLISASISNRANAQMNFDNATLVASGASASWISGVGVFNIASGGLTINTGGFNVGVASTSVFSGVGGLTVSGGSIFTLTAANTYTGQTVIQGGSTLALTGVGAISASSGVIANGTFDISGITATSSSIQSLGGSGTVAMGTKALTLTNANDTFFGTFQGGAGLTLLSGMETLAGNNAAFTGPTTVQGGTLAVNGSLGGPLGVLPGGRLQGTGTVGTTTNGGVIAPGNSIGTLTIAGNYTGSGGTLEIESVLAGDASPTDRLVVTGNTSGSTTVRVLNRGGLGAQTIEGIKIVDIAGASNGTFALQGDYVIGGQQAVVGGAYAYTLQKNGISTPADGDWYLRSVLINPPPSAPAGPLYQAGVPLYENYAQVLLGMNQAPSLQQRVGNRYWGGSEAMARAGVNTAQTAEGSWTQSAFWGRIEGGQSALRPSNTTGSTYDSDEMKVQAGLDGVGLDNTRGRLIVGLTAQYGLTTAFVNSVFGNGRIRAQGTGVGATATWYGHDGFYVDGQAQTMFYHSDLSSVLAGSVIHGNEGFGYAFGVEGGKRIAIGNGFWLAPQAQLAYSKVGFDAFTDRFGALVSLGNADSLLGRLGLSLNHQRTWNDGTGIVRSDLYAIGNLHYEFLEGTRIDVAGTGFASGHDRLWGSIGGGGTYSWANGRYAVFGEITYRASVDDPADNHGYKGTGGFRIVW
ncbi:MULTISPECIES: autotransporter family protein [Bradyrhizobium]|uniref:autotransporter family protein n=1 Tax=Bradyrhizobium TaxID=374 RepID=UPI0004AE5122|nr:MULTISPECIES: autotransporter outer membrane beta-barrel domain-containing protein [unclassified Bradyrhizobium]